MLYEHGVLVDQSYEKARHWFAKSAGSGSAFAMNQLALYLEKGLGGPASASDAFQWASEAAKREYIPAVFTLARYCEAAIGTTADLVRASRLYEEAAESGFAAAASYLALVYEEVSGEPKTRPKRFTTPPTSCNTR